MATFDTEGKIYYHNTKTKKTTYERPNDFDGYDPSAGGDNVYLETFTDFKATPFCILRLYYS